MKKAMILGIASGLGSLLANHLSGKGWSVYGSARNPEFAAEKLDKIPFEKIIKLDFTEPETFDEFENNIKDYKNSIEEAKVLIDKYSEKLKNVRNNREYNSIVKEEEFQKLEIELCEKKIKELLAKSELKNETIKTLQENIQEKQKHLDAKKSELKEIMKETEKEENVLIEQSKKFEEKIEDRLVKAYKRIRGNVKNGMAIVALERGASAGSYFTIPPQIQMEIASRQRIITDEYSGRILVDAELANEEKDKINKLIGSL